MAASCAGAQVFVAAIISIAMSMPRTSPRISPQRCARRHQLVERRLERPLLARAAARSAIDRRASPRRRTSGRRRAPRRRATSAPRPPRDRADASRRSRRDQRRSSRNPIDQRPPLTRSRLAGSAGTASPWRPRRARAISLGGHVDAALRERRRRRLEQQTAIALRVGAALGVRRARRSCRVAAPARRSPSTATCSRCRGRRNVTSTTIAVSMRPAATRNAIR